MSEISQVFQFAWQIFNLQITIYEYTFSIAGLLAFAMLFTVIFNVISSLLGGNSE